MEQLFARITTERLLEIIAHNDTTVHAIELASNSYGEFLFVTTSRFGSEGSIHITFWGAGYHEYRERWLTKEWFWHQTDDGSSKLASEMDREAARANIQERIAEVSQYSNDTRQSSRGKLFELLADLTDDDGAIVDVDELAGWPLDDGDDGVE